MKASQRTTLHTAIRSSNHTQLTDPSKQIRLLKIQPYKHERRIACQMIAVNVDATPPYAAISYTWGSPEKTHSVNIDGKEVTVGQNCSHALWQACHDACHDYYWIDALCIDQLNLEEKGLQVQMMRDIFKKALSVLVCVGPHADGTDILFHVFAELHVTLSHPEELQAMRSRMEDGVIGFVAENMIASTERRRDPISFSLFCILEDIERRYGNSVEGSDIDVRRVP